MPSDVGRTTILIVEDDPILCQILGRVVIGEGHSILQVRSGSEALHLLGGCSVQVVLLDLGLREGTGLQLAETLRAQYPELSVILLSNHRLESSVLSGWAARKLTKSVNLPDLRGAVSAALAEAKPQHSSGHSPSNDLGRLVSKAPLAPPRELALSTNP